jgi:DNA-3-methyladenine glycosylase II
MKTTRPLPFARGPIRFESKDRSATGTVRRHDRPTAPNDEVKALYPDTTFPTPENIMVAEFDALRACGFSAAKIATIKAIAEGALSGLIPPRNVAGAMDDEELIARVATIKGIGRWTVEMLLMYSLERLDILPADDFGVREGYRSLKSLPEQPKPNALREIGKAWAPHRTVAAWYLWRMPRERGNVLK